MRYYAVPSQTIMTLDFDQIPFKQGIFNVCKVKRVGIKQVVDAFNKSESILLFENEHDAINYSLGKSFSDLEFTGIANFRSPPILQVVYPGYIKTGFEGKQVSLSEVTLISGKMLFVGKTKVEGLPYRLFNEVDHNLSTNKNLFFSSDFDLRMVPVIFATGALMGWVVDSYISDSNKSSAAFLTGLAMVLMYFKLCSSTSHSNQEKDTKDEIQRLSFKRN